MFKFNNKINENEEVKKNQYSSNGKFSREICDLHEIVDRLNAELFAIKNPNGKLELSYPRFISCYNYSRHLWFTYSDGVKIHKTDIASMDCNFGFYKIQVSNNKAYIGIKSGDENDDKEIYYIVDIRNETAIQADNNSFEKFDAIEWSKNE